MRLEIGNAVPMVLPSLRGDDLYLYAGLKPKHIELLGRAFAALHSEQIWSRIRHFYGKKLSAQQLALGICYDPKLWRRLENVAERRASARRPYSLAERDVIEKVERALARVTFFYPASLRAHAALIADARTARSWLKYANGWPQYLRQRLKMATCGTLELKIASRPGLEALYFICAGKYLRWPHVAPKLKSGRRAGKR